MQFATPKTLLLVVFNLFIFNLFAQTVQDDFEGNGTITTWFGDDCGIDTGFSNPFQQGINSSPKVLQYTDAGGQYANIRFDVSNNFDFSNNATFSLKIYVPSSSISGNQPNQISLKLQDGTLAMPWSTQCEIIKSISLDTWQTVSFDFLNDVYINLDHTSLPPTQRTDFNRVVIQVNGENNNDLVVAYIDDVLYDGSIATDPEFNALVWADEFDGSGAVDASKWHHQTQLPNGNSWFNGEIQHYTNRVDNALVENGNLNIIGKRENFTDQGVTKDFTSARLNSKFAFQYGKVEVRAKLPQGPGTWPAIWTLGKNINEDGAWFDLQGLGTTPWPDCGEIDIMEHWGTNQNYISSATHTPSSFGGTINVGGQTIPTASSDFHVYSLKWYPEKLVFGVDGVTHYVYEPNDINASTWPFNAEQYLLLNFAILPSIEANFTQDTLVIDYVRVYQNAPTSTTELQHFNFNLKTYPNPANHQVQFSYELTQRAQVKLEIHDFNGRLIGELVNTNQAEGQQFLNFNASALQAGFYLVTLQVNGVATTQKLAVIK